MRETIEATVDGGYRVRIAVERCARPGIHEAHVYAAAANKYDRSGHYAHCKGTTTEETPGNTTARTMLSESSAQTIWERTIKGQTYRFMLIPGAAVYGFAWKVPAAGRTELLRTF